MEKSAGTIASESKLPLLLTSASWSQSKGSDRARRAIRFAFLHARLSAGGKDGPRRDGRGCGRQRVSGFCRGHRRRLNGALPSARCGSDSETGRRTDPHFLHGFLLSGARESRGAACRGGSRQRGEESLFRQLGHGSHRSGHQAGAIPHAARQDHRVSRLLSRTHARRAFAHRVQSRAAQGIRRAAGRRVSHSLSEFLSLPARQSIALHLRRIGDVPGA